MNAKHGPNRLSNYLEIHSTVMLRYVDEAFVLVDELSIDALGDGVIAITGVIRCAGGVVITVDKYLSIIDPGPPAVVQTSAYSYNASLAGVGNIFRYCSPHGDHNGFHHRHAFDVFADDVVGTIESMGDQWPTLGDVIEELRGWTSSHSGKLRWD